MPMGKRRVLSRAISVETVHGQQYKRNGDYVAQRITDPGEEDDFLQAVETGHGGAKLGHGSGGIVSLRAE